MDTIYVQFFECIFQDMRSCMGAAVQDVRSV